MEDMQVTATGYDFRPAHAAMQRYVDGDLLAGFSSAVLADVISTRISDEGA